MLWAVDTFGAMVQGDILEADDADPDLYAGSFDAMNTWNTPWLEWVDAARFAAHVDTTASLPLEAVASAHGPILRGDRIADAFARTPALAARPALPTPGQACSTSCWPPSTPAAEPRPTVDRHPRRTHMGTLPKHGSVTVEAAATPEQVWTLLADITRAGEWSHENRAATGSTAPRPPRPAPASAVATRAAAASGRASARCWPPTPRR